MSKAAVRKIRANIRAYGSHTAPAVAKRGSLAIAGAIATGLRVYIESRPWAYQDEMIEYLFDDWNIIVDQSTVSRALSRMKISRNMLKRIAAERNQTCRDHYQLQLSQYTADMLVYLDESAANEHTKDRKMGWSSFGITPIVVRPVKRSQRHSILPAYPIDGIIAFHIHQGSISGARFEWWLENEVLPQCNPFPGKNSVLILDNASIHHSPVSL